MQGKRRGFRKFWTSAAIIWFYGIMNKEILTVYNAASEDNSGLYQQSVALSSLKVPFLTSDGSALPSVFNISDLGIPAFKDGDCVIAVTSSLKAFNFSASTDGVLEAMSQLQGEPYELYVVKKPELDAAL